MVSVAGAPPLCLSLLGIALTLAYFGLMYLGLGTACRPGWLFQPLHPPSDSRC